MAARLPAHRRRRQILDVALGVFGQAGYHGASMESVADAAGVTKPVLYQHFASKRELYLALLDDVAGRLVEAVVQATKEADSPRGRVEAGFRTYFRFVVDERSAFQLLFGGGLDRDEEFAAVGRRVQETMADTVAELIDADIDHDHRQLLAYGVVGLAEATSRHGLAEGIAIDPDRYAARVAELAWAGLRGVHRD